VLLDAQDAVVGHYPAVQVIIDEVERKNTQIIR